jgi:hypothetical protein
MNPSPFWVRDVCQASAIAKTPTVISTLTDRELARMSDAAMTILLEVAEEERRRELVR